MSVFHAILNGNSPFQLTSVLPTLSKLPFLLMSKSISNLREFGTTDCHPHLKMRQTCQWPEDKWFLGSVHTKRTYKQHWPTPAMIVVVVVKHKMKFDPTSLTLNSKNKRLMRKCPMNQKIPLILFVHFFRRPYHRRMGWRIGQWTYRPMGVVSHR